MKHLIEVHPKTVIPDRLLRRDLDDESVQLLFWLTRANADLTRAATWEVRHISPPSAPWHTHVAATGV
jgi:hypothetical protein